jgi:hypothetical protein
MSKSTGSVGDDTLPALKLPPWRAVDLLYLPQDRSKPDPMQIKGRLPYWAVLAILGVVGLAMIIAPAICEWKFDHGVISAIGTAFLIAAILGATIDRWMKGEIAADVFRATLGYILPVEFHKAMHDLISFPLMCEAHEMWYVLTEMCGDTVKVNVKIERRLHNMTMRPQEIDPST